MPYRVILLVAVLLVAFFPGSATFLPRLVFRARRESPGQVPKRTSGAPALV